MNQTFRPNKVRTKTGLICSFSTMIEMLPIINTCQCIQLKDPTMMSMLISFNWIVTTWEVNPSSYMILEILVRDIVIALDESRVEKGQV